MNKPIYTPPGKIIQRITYGNEYVGAITKEEYTGPYHIYPNGSIFSGLKFTRNSERLEPLTTPYNEPNTSQYAKQTGIQFNNHISPKFYYPAPTPNDYESGYIDRYFVQKINEPTEIDEVTQEMYQNANKENRKGVNKTLYRVLRLRWLISGIPEEVVKTHDRILQLNETLMPGISKYLSDRIEFLR